jgi:hypothetical protein
MVNTAIIKKNHQLLCMELSSYQWIFMKFYIGIFLKNLLRKFLSKNTASQAI